MTTPPNATIEIRPLPDLLRPGLELVFIGINPSVYSALKGHYFARPGNRFWPCLTASTLGARLCAALGKDRLEPGDDRALPACGIGFTDVVKRPTPKAGDLTSADFTAGVVELVAKLEILQPRVACFQGVTGFRPVHQALGLGPDGPVLGEQPGRIGATRLFLTPSPSGANAHFSRQDQIAWYDRLARIMD